MFRTQTFTSSFYITVFDKTNSIIIVFGNTILRPINNRLFRMAFSYMLRLAHYLKIINTIIGFNMVNVVHFLASQKLTAKMQLHYITVVKHSFTVYVDTKITQRSKEGLTFLKHVPVGRNTIVPMTLFSRTVHTTNSVSVYSWFIASIKFTNLNHVPNSSALCQ